jgi:hypothetical protein
VVVPVTAKRSNNLRTAGIVAGSLVVVALVALVIANFASSGSSGPAKPKHVANSTGLSLKLGSVGVQSAGPPPRVSASVKQTLLDASQSYVDDAILSPLEKGKLNAAYAKVFDLGVRGDATGRDRATLTEVRTGKLTGTVKATATPVRLDAMGDQTGKLALVAATFGVDVSANGSNGPLKISRLAELTFAPEQGRWLVTAYRVGVKRTATARTAAAVARAGSGVVS